MFDRKFIGYEFGAKLKIIILITLGILFALAPMITVNSSLITGNNNLINLDNENLKTSAVSGKIHIDGNSGWVDFRNAGNCTGNGTYSDPYVIEDLIIDGGGSGSCILIEKSSVYFKIENCMVYNSGSDVDDAGIRLLGVSNGILISNDANYNVYGIFIGYASIQVGMDEFSAIFSNNNNISGNTANYNWGGIFLGQGSNYNEISGNIANYNSWAGIELESCKYNLISGNTANYNEYGIYLIGSCNNHITNNILTNNTIADYVNLDPCEEDLSLNYLLIILIISITIIGVAVFIIYQNRKKFRKPQEDLEFL